MHPEVLDQRGQALFSRLPHFQGFYLAGGTAAALYLGHRISVDFDLFSGREIPDALFDTVKRVFSGKPIKLSVSSKDDLTVFIDERKISFLHYPFPLVLGVTEYQNVALARLQEIGAMKAYTIGRRGAYKDYVDLYFLLAEQHTTLQAIIALAEKKYGGEFNARLFLEQLVYLDDITDTNVQLLRRRELTKEQAQLFFEERIRATKFIP